AVAEDEPMRRFDLEDLPVAMWLVALGPGHVVLDATAGRQVVLGERGRVGRWAPPALELAGIGPQLPHPLGCRIELGFQSHGQCLRILADGSDGHWLLSFVVAMRSVIRSIRLRHSSSYWSSRRRTTRSRSRLVRTILRRPMRSFVTSP